MREPTAQEIQEQEFREFNARLRSPGTEELRRVVGRVSYKLSTIWFNSSDENDRQDQDRQDLNSEILRAEYHNGINHYSLKLKVLLVDVDYNVDHEVLWSGGGNYNNSRFYSFANKKRNEYQLSQMLKLGYLSSPIWKSFQRLPLATQQTYLSRNPELKRYQQLVTLLTGNNQAQPFDNPLTPFLSLYRQHPTFVTNQLQYNPELRRAFLCLVQTANLNQFRPLLQVVATTPALAHDFEQLLYKELNPALQRAIDLPRPDDPDIKNFSASMGKSIIVRKDILKAILRAPKENFSPEFIAEVLLHHRGNIDKYRSALNSPLWKASNYLKLQLPNFLAPFFKPAISLETLEIMKPIITGLDKEAAAVPAVEKEEDTPFLVTHDAKVTFIGFRRLFAPLTPSPLYPAPSPGSSGRTDKNYLFRPPSNEWRRARFFCMKKEVDSVEAEDSHVENPNGLDFAPPVR